MNKISPKNKISEKEFARIFRGIREDRQLICRHNPIGSPEETLLWMLLGCLISYLSLSEIETPCFNGMPTAQTYLDAIHFVLKERMDKNFNVEKYLRELEKK
jgi:hypothetical protein